MRLAWVLANVGKEARTVDGARFAERTGGYISGANVVTGEAVSDLKIFKIPAATCWVLELRK